MPTTIPYRAAGVGGGRVHRDTDSTPDLWDPAMLVAMAILLLLLAAQFDPDTLWPIPLLIGP